MCLAVDGGEGDCDTLILLFDIGKRSGERVGLNVIRNVAVTRLSRQAPNVLLRQFAITAP